MENDTRPAVKKIIAPYTVDQALIGLGLEEADKSTLRYLNFFSTQIPFTAAYFLHVLPKLNILTAFYEKESQLLISDKALYSDMRNQLKHEVKGLLSTWDDVYMEYDIVEGDPLAEIVKSASSLQADLLVIGQKKGTSARNIFAKNLARSTTADAIIIPVNAKSKISTILVPIDFSDNSVKALEAAIAVHKQLKGPVQIICLHIYDMPNTNYFRDEAPWLKVKSTVEKNLADGFNSFLETVAAEYKNRIAIALVERQTTGTASFIMDFAKANEVDFMVMGARGHSKVHLLLMGSVTENVLDTNDNIPILIIR